jgi:O-antigen/teichoic acid export membrane protein
LKRKFVTNLALLLLLNIVIKPVYAFGIDIGVQNAVGTFHYGNYFILLNFSLIFQIFLDLGFENFSRREIARHSHLLKRYFSRILPVKGLLGLVYVILCSIVGLFMGWGVNEFRLLIILMFNQFLANLILYFRANLGGLHRFRTDSVLSVADKFIVIITCGIMLLNPVTRKSFRIEWLVYAQAAAYLVTSIISFCILIKTTSPISFRFDLRYYRLFFKRSLPFALLILLMAVYMRIDSVMLGKLLVNGKEQAGIYAQSYRIIEIFSNYGYLFTLILLPLFSKMIKQKESIEELTSLSFILLFVPAFIITIGCFSFRYEIIRILYNEHAKDSAKVFGILIFSFLGMCTTYIFGTLLTANGSLLQLNTMAIIAVALNLTLNLILIKRYSVFGAAIANVTTQLFTSVYQMILVKRLFDFRIHNKTLARLGIFIILIVSVIYFLKEINMKWVYLLGIYLFVAILLSIATKLINIKSILRMGLTV